MRLITTAVTHPTLTIVLALGLSSLWGCYSRELTDPPEESSAQTRSFWETGQPVTIAIDVDESLRPTSGHVELRVRHTHSDRFIRRGIITSASDWGWTVRTRLALHEEEVSVNVRGPDWEREYILPIDQEGTARQTVR